MKTQFKLTLLATILLAHGLTLARSSLRVPRELSVSGEDMLEIELCCDSNCQFCLPDKTCDVSIVFNIPLLFV